MSHEAGHNATTEFNNRFGQHGVQIGGAPQSSGDQSPFVYLGSVPGPPPAAFQFPRRDGALLEGPPTFQEIEGPPEAVPDVSTVETEFSKIFTFDHDDLLALQDRLFRAGYYGSIDPSQIVRGVPDGRTKAAYLDALEDAAQYYTAGVNRTPNQVIDERIAAIPPAAQDSGGRIDASLAAIDVSDPAALRALADRLSQDLFGRDATDDEKSKVVASIQGAQSEAQQRVISARDRLNQAVTPQAEAALSPAEIARTAYQAGFRGDDLVTAVAVALAESRGNPGALNASGEHSVGLWQINMDAHGTNFGNETSLRDPLANAQAAYRLWRSDGFQPWATFTEERNSYRQFLDVARQATSLAGTDRDFTASPLTRTITRTSVDPTARTREILQAGAPEEAAATALSRTFGDFWSLITGFGGGG